MSSLIARQSRFLLRRTRTPMKADTQVRPYATPITLEVFYWFFSSLPRRGAGWATSVALWRSPAFPWHHASGLQGHGVGAW